MSKHDSWLAAGEFASWPHAYYRDDLNFTELRVLLSLIRHVNADGECWPAYSTIARHWHLDRRAAMRAVKSLQAKGVIEIIRRADGRNLYRLRVNPGDNSTSEMTNPPPAGGDKSTTTKVTPLPPGDDTDTTNVMTQIPPKLNQRTNPKNKSKEQEEPFLAEFITQYPEGKLGNRVKAEILLRRITDPAEQAQILDGLACWKNSKCWCNDGKIFSAERFLREKLYKERPRGRVLSSEEFQAIVSGREAS